MAATKLSSSDFPLGCRKSDGWPQLLSLWIHHPSGCHNFHRLSQPTTKTCGSSNRQLCLEDSLAAWLDLSWNCTAVWDFLPKPPPQGPGSRGWPRALPDFSSSPLSVLHGRCLQQIPHLILVSAS